MGTIRLSSTTWPTEGSDGRNCDGCLPVFHFGTYQPLHLVDVWTRLRCLVDGSIRLSLDEPLLHAGNVTGVYLLALGLFSFLKIRSSSIPQ